MQCYTIIKTRCGREIKNRVVIVISIVTNSSNIQIKIKFTEPTSHVKKTVLYY